ncbi:hypothetical protein INR49_013546, partial [Caranx melampygus]
MLLQPSPRGKLKKQREQIKRQQREKRSTLVSELCDRLTVQTCYVKEPLVSFASAKP